MKTSTISKKTSLLIAHAILWGSAIIATGIVLASGSHTSTIIWILAMNAGISLMIIGYDPKSK